MKEQTISNLKKLKSFHNGSYGADINRAIQALEQEPCEDCISRAAVLEGKVIHQFCDGVEIINSYAVPVKYIEQLPSIQPTAKENLVVEDCISRQEVLDMMQMRMGDKELYKAVYDLPPVTPKPKMGEWIVTGYDYKCTNCEAEINGEINYMSKSKIKYCPYCGIKLEGEWDNNG